MLALLAGCGGGPSAQTAARAPDPAMQPVPNAGFDAWVGTLTGSGDPRLTEAVHEARETLLAGLGKDLSISETHSQA